VSQHFCARAVWHGRGVFLLNKALLSGKLSLLFIDGVQLLLGVFNSRVDFVLGFCGGSVLLFRRRVVRARRGFLRGGGFRLVIVAGGEGEGKAKQ